jgi:hypothetical protein
MRSVVLYELLSLDAVADRPIDFILDFDEVMRENLGRVIARRHPWSADIRRVGQLLAWER